jgi:hypothetical protein
MKILVMEVLGCIESNFILGEFKKFVNLKIINIHLGKLKKMIKGVHE